MLPIIQVPICFFVELYGALRAYCAAEDLGMQRDTQNLCSDSGDSDSARHLSTHAHGCKLHIAGVSCRRLRIPGLTTFPGPLFGCSSVGDELCRHLSGGKTPEWQVLKTRIFLQVLRIVRIFLQKKASR